MNVCIVFYVQFLVQKRASRSSILDVIEISSIHHLVRRTMHREKYGLMLLILTHVTMWVESSSCVFRLEHGATHRPTPLQIRRGASITSCGLSCINLSECHFFAFLNDVCVLTQQIDEKEEGRWIVYKKVIFFQKIIIYVGKLCMRRIFLSFHFAPFPP